MATIIKFIKRLLYQPKVKLKKSIDSQYIIPCSEHHLSTTDISANALKVLTRLGSAGYEAYLVGGSVRDLLLNKVPKDFDVATNATPQQIRKLFRNARIIGKRFKLVHILFHRDIIEVATFRGSEGTLQEANQQTNEIGMLVRDNAYGSLEEDAWRRDFTINSLYYNVEDNSIFDLTGGVADISKRTLRMIGDPLTRYQEDPVRMLRVIRFAAKLDFDIAVETVTPLISLCQSIRHISGSRLFDEITKLYQCGEARAAHELLIKHGLFASLFEQTEKELSKKNTPVKALIEIALENTDTRIRDMKPVTPAFLFAVLLWYPLQARATALEKKEKMDPLPALEKAMSQVIQEQNKVITVPKRFTQIMREIWLLQYRFSKRTGLRAFHLLEHQRFRAAYDFLALRSLVGDESMELAQWWTTFQEVDEHTRQHMVDELTIPLIQKHDKVHPTEPQ